MAQHGNLRDAKEFSSALRYVIRLLIPFNPSSPFRTEDIGGVRCARDRGVRQALIREIKCELAFEHRLVMVNFQPNLQTFLLSMMSENCQPNSTNEI